MRDLANISGPSSSERPSRFGPRRLIVALTAAILATLWAALIYDAKRMQEVALAEAGRDAQNLSTAYREHIQKIISAVDQVLLATVAAHEARPDEFRIPTWIGASPLLAGMAVHVGLIGPDGVLRVSNEGTEGLDLSDRAHFRYHLDPSARQPHISVPIFGRVTKQWTVHVTRRLTRKDGAFDGIAMVSIDPFYFSRFFENVDLGENGVALLVGLDGIVRARQALNNDEIGQDISTSPLFKKLPFASSARFETRAKVDGVNRIYGYAAIPEYPLVVEVGFATDDVVAAPQRQAKLQMAVGFVLTGVIATLVWFLVGEMKRRSMAERKRHEDALRLIVDNNPHPKFVYCPETLQLLTVNGPAGELYGYSREQFFQMKATDLHPATGREEFAKFLRAAAAGGTNQRRQKAWQHRTSDGRLIEVEVFLRRFSYNGRDAVLASALDITEQRRAEKERDENREFLNLVIENVPMTIFAKELRELRYVLVNRAAEQLWGVSREKLIGRTAQDIFPKEMAELIAESEAKVLNSPSHKLFGADQVIHMPHNGARSVRTRLLAVPNSEGRMQYLVGVIEDLTERKSIEEQLRQAQKMEAVGNMTGGVAHDFNNLLTVIIGNLELLQLHVAGDPTAEHMLDTILQASERGADLTRQMLAFSRRQPLQPKPTDVNKLIQNTKRLLDRSLGENITIDVQLGSDLPSVLIDESQLVAALVNIALNARDAMARGGALTVTTRTIDLDECYAARYAEVVAGPYVVIEMTDTGTGIPPEIVGRIFDPFFTTKPVGKGTGLGLSMAYGFLKQSGGHISVYSEVGRGTTFKLFLPLAAPAGTASEIAGDGGQKLQRAEREEVILAVDDNPEVRATVAIQLRQLGYQVLEAANAKAALEILETGGRIDLLFTDVIMPGGIDGKELATRARIKRPELKVLFTSGFPGKSLTGTGEFEENDVLLSKPYRQRDLARNVRDILQRHS